MIKNKSTLAKLLAEEDIFVVHKQMETAYFNSKSRELGLPIWKDEEMTKDIYDLMVGHEIGHALWTPLDMLEKAAVRKINHGFVNIIEDARIEKFAVRKYPGLVGVFKRGYIDLTKKDFFGTADKDVNTYNLIDRINIFFKTADTNIVFSDEEKVWVDRVAKTETEDEVLDLAEELYAWMSENENETETDNHDSGMSDECGEMMPDSSDGSGESDSSGEGNESGESDDTENGESSDADGSDADAGDSDGDSTEGKSDETGEGDTEDESAAGEETSKSSSVEGGKNSTGKSGPPVAETDTASGKGLDALRDKGAGDRIYAKIPKVDLKNIIIDTKTLLEEYTTHYNKQKADDDLYWNNTRGELETLKNDSKKTVAYMVKEFEMKKAADQYARASTSKTGTLDMSKLHTYKYNEDLFRKVTTLPGATNHGMVMVLDWSGSMAQNLLGTLSQMYNLIWFCRRTKIPFEVFAFSDMYGRRSRNNRASDDRNWANEFKAGDIALSNFHLLNFFSSNMTSAEEMDMMHILWMYAARYAGFRNWKELGYPYYEPSTIGLGGTPLNESIIAMMDLVPKFKNDTGVQKVNTIFLTDGASHRLDGVFDYNFDSRTNEHSETIKPCHNNYWHNKNVSKIIISDPVMNKTFEVTDMTSDLLRILKNRMPGMNVVGFFIAGNGKSGRVDKKTLSGLLGWDVTGQDISEKIKFLNKNKYLALTQLGYDEYYILPGGDSLKTENETLDDELIGAGKAKLKSAFGKMSKGKLASRQLLNKFVALVA